LRKGGKVQKKDEDFVQGTTQEFARAFRKERFRSPRGHAWKKKGEKCTGAIGHAWKGEQKK